MPSPVSPGFFRPTRASTAQEYFDRHVTETFRTSFEGATNSGYLEGPLLVEESAAYSRSGSMFVETTLVAAGQANRGFFRSVNAAGSLGNISVVGDALFTFQVTSADDLAADQLVGVGIFPADPVVGDFTTTGLNVRLVVGVDNAGNVWIVTGLATRDTGLNVASGAGFGERVRCQIGLIHSSGASFVKTRVAVGGLEDDFTFPGGSIGGRPFQRWGFGLGTNATPLTRLRATPGAYRLRAIQ